MREYANRGGYVNIFLAALSLSGGCENDKGQAVPSPPSQTAVSTVTERLETILDRPLVLHEDTKAKIVYPTGEINVIQEGDKERVAVMLDNHIALISPVGRLKDDESSEFFLYNILSHKKEYLNGTGPGDIVF